MSDVIGRSPFDEADTPDDTPPTGEQAVTPPSAALWPRVDASSDLSSGAPRDGAPAPVATSASPIDPWISVHRTSARGSLPPAPPRSPPTASGRGAHGRPPRPWVGVALVAAVIGAIVGGGIVWAARSTTPGVTNHITIQESTTPPGAALVDDVSIPRLVRQVSPSVVSIDVSTGGFEADQGTGMIITPDGLVVTNNHVIAAAANGGVITITRTGTNATLGATLLGTDPTDDVALLKIEGVSGLPAVTFGNSNRLEVGDGVVAIGNALGLSAKTPTVTQGIVSALGRKVTAGDSLSSNTETLTNMIQTDAAINPGNSGGPLIDSNGLVVGMNTAVAGQTGAGQSAQNIGFAIPAARIEGLLGTLERSKPSVTPEKRGGYLGVEVVSVTPTYAAQQHLSVSSGAYVSALVAGQAAATAGIRVGDVITSVNGVTVSSDQALSSEMTRLTPGQTVSVVVDRDGSSFTIPVTVKAWPPRA